MKHTIHRDIQSLAPIIQEFKATTAAASARFSGVCGFDASFADMATLLDAWFAGTLADRF